MKKTFTKRRKLLFFVGACIASLLLGTFVSYIYTFGFTLPHEKEKPPVSIAKTFVKQCESTGERCYSTEFAKLTKVENLDLSLAVLDEVNKIDPKSRGCHLIAHYIATEETLKNTAAWEEVLSRLPTSRCTGGFLHGVFEARRSVDESLVINEETIPELCNIVKARAQGGNDQDCSHIMGHLLMVEHNTDIEKSVNVCDRLPGQLQYECHSGVFMENETRESIVDHGMGDFIPWDKNTTQIQQSLCEKQTGIAAKACWREISHMFAFIAKEYPPELFRLCEQAEDITHVKDCYQHGVGISVVTSNFNPKYMNLLCIPFSRSKDYAECVDYAIGSMMASSVHFSDRVKLLCNAIPNVYKTGCYEKLGVHIVRLAGANELINVCKDVPYPYKEVCEKPYL